MTKAAEINQASMERVFKSLKTTGHDRAVVVMDLNKRTITVTLGEDEEPESRQRHSANPWDSLLQQ